jgi:hypothetical protein
MENIFKAGTTNRSKNIPAQVQKAFLKAGNQVNYQFFLSISILLDPNPHSQYGSTILVLRVPNG